jgi:putative selenium metabolism hydrolase
VGRSLWKACAGEKKTDGMMTEKSDRRTERMKLTEEWNKKTIELAQALIRSRSLSGNEGEAAAVLKDYMERTGIYDEVMTDRLGNVIGHIKGKNPGSRLLFDGHIDTVPAGNPSGWTHDPFGGDIADGRLYGRGASDMKGAVAAFTTGAEMFARLCGKDFSGDIYVAGVVQEECFEGVAARSVSAAVKPDYVVIGEASEMNLKIGQRGRAEIVVETFGVPAHSANPEKGVNAVYKMCGVIEALQKLTPPEHPVLGRGILELTDVKSMPYPGASVVPEYCRATYDRRLLTGETRESVLKPILEKIEELQSRDPKLKVKVSYASGKDLCYTGKEISAERFFPGWLFGGKEAYIQKIKDELEAMGYRPQLACYNFCTNGSHYAGEAGIPVIGLGPSCESLAHVIDESISLKELTEVSECYAGVCRALLR